MHRLFSLKSTKHVGFSSCVPFMSCVWALLSFSQLAWEWEFLNRQSSLTTTPVGTTSIIHLFHATSMLMPPRTMLISSATQSLRACVEVLIWHDVVPPSRGSPIILHIVPRFGSYVAPETSNAGLHTTYRKNHRYYFSFPFRSLIKAWSDTGLSTSLGKSLLVLTPFLRILFTKLCFWHTSCSFFPFELFWTEPI